VAFLAGEANYSHSMGRKHAGEISYGLDTIAASIKWTRNLSVRWTNSQRERLTQNVRNAKQRATNLHGVHLEPSRKYTQDRVIIM
jgi:hypothetical protein